MAKSPSPTTTMSVKDAVYKLQLTLLDGISQESQLFTAGSILSQSDYQDVVIERSIANLCGYPLCPNPLPSDRPPRKGRYRISLKEHKVYDLKETSMYCSPVCVINSRAFACFLEEERQSMMDSAKVSEVVRLFGELGLGDKKEEEEKEKGVLGRTGDLGFGDLKIQEKTGAVAGDVALEDWIGPSNAIDGHVPKHDQSQSPSRLKCGGKGSKPEVVDSEGRVSMMANETGFTSTIIIGDQSNTGKASSADKKNVVTGNRSNPPKSSPARKKNTSDTRVKRTQDEVSVERVDGPKESQLKSSLKSSGAKTVNCSVTWADEKDATDAGGRNLCDVREIEDKPEILESSVVSNEEDIRTSLRFQSAESCAIALSEAAEAVALGESDVGNAVSEAGIIILPNTHNGDDGNSSKPLDVPETEQDSVKWPRTPVFLNCDGMDSEDSWHDTPPEGFNLTLSSFATMWMTLFGWVSASSLAYIYGKDERSQDEFLYVDGREYPCKIVLSDGRSSEIKQTLAGCIARALPALVASIRLPTPISTLEQALGHLLDTMSFVDPLPPFKTKQWHVIVLLFLDALSVRRIPGLAQHMSSKRMLLPKVLDAAQVSWDEYGVMKGLLIPLGWLPEFSAQSGG